MIYVLFILYALLMYICIVYCVRCMCYVLYVACGVRCLLCVSILYIVLRYVSMSILYVSCALVPVFLLVRVYILCACCVCFVFGVGLRVCVCACKWILLMYLLLCVSTHFLCGRVTVCNPYIFESTIYCMYVCRPTVLV